MTGERLLGAHQAEGGVVDDPDTLVLLGAEVGVPEDETRRMLTGDAYADAVEADIQEARRLGVTGVPFVVLGRAYGDFGAQPTETLPICAAHRARERCRQRGASCDL